LILPGKRAASPGGRGLGPPGKATIGAVKAPASALPDARRPEENFPVASWLCPPRLRPAVAAVYWFARTADDIADEGPATAAQRLADLDALRADLAACCAGRTASPRWRPVFAALAAAVREFELPEAPLAALLSAFRQDVVKTAEGRAYGDRAELLDYCARSANPVGRLLLHLYRIADPRALERSDHICTALQLANFWQDLSVDLPRGRRYLPLSDLRDHGLDPLAPQDWAAHPAAPRLLAGLVAWTGQLMDAGAPLVHQVPGRAGWELRLVVQGGRRILDKIEAGGFRSWTVRPRLARADLAPLLWRALQM